jgi:hypothetical protein
MRPIDIKRQARVPYRTVIGWLTVGHPRAGLLPSVNLGGGRRNSYRVRVEDWEQFLVRLQTESRSRQPASPEPRPQPAAGRRAGLFRY